MFIGRHKELSQLKSALSLNKSSFIAVYGRRRVGKTELIRHFCKMEDVPMIEFSGTVDFSNIQHLKLFSNVVKKFFTHNDTLTNWADAFGLLEEYLIKTKENKKTVIFFDEVPWIDKPKSGFLGALAYFWNTFCTKRKNILLVVCGSSASYMLKRIVHNRGALHGRLTEIIPVEQFDLPTVNKMLKAQGFRISTKTVTDIYMAFGGVPRYIAAMDKTETPSENINRLCFTTGGLFKNEYNDLYSSLFKNSKTHYVVMDALSVKWSGHTKKELANAANVSEAYIKTPIDELFASGFISETKKLGQVKRDIIYRSNDCFSFFYNKWMKNSSGRDWNKFISTIEYRIWAGFAFENICHMHTEHIKKILGISGIETANHYWRYIPKSKTETGAQIDLIIEHLNKSRNLEMIECKYSSSKYTISRDCRNDIARKMEVFHRQTDEKYNIRIVFITPYGVEKNEHYYEMVNKEITIDDIIATDIS